MATLPSHPPPPPPPQCLTLGPLRHICLLLLKEREREKKKIISYMNQKIKNNIKKKLLKYILLKKKYILKLVPEWYFKVLETLISSSSLSEEVRKTVTGCELKVWEITLFFSSSSSSQSSLSEEEDKKTVSGCTPLVGGSSTTPLVEGTAEK